MLCCRHALDQMDDDASIVFVSSIAATRAGSQLVAYDASKAGLSGLAAIWRWRASRAASA
jgi:NAD(P)-dependent dehydrogenase (short-subunit alcohol dehydrogenase family)